MPLGDPSRTLAPLDKLNVFISSTIGECADERKQAAAGVRATNHEPIVFEKLGARPYHPREVYLSRLQQSHIVVAIYKSSYGYVDTPSGMTISGLEDEYRHARASGKPVLVFINRNAANRESRLQILIDEVMSSDETVAFYERPEELETLVKDSVTAVITQRFFDADALEDALRSPRGLAITLPAPPGGLIPRTNLLDALGALADSYPVIRVSGEPGNGKTVLLSQMAARAGYELVLGNNLSPKELFGVLTNRIRGASPLYAQQFATFEGARSAFTSAWAEAPSVRLMLDDSPHIASVLSAISEVGELATLPRKVLVFSTRDTNTPAQPQEAVLPVPPLTEEEIAIIVSRGRFGIDHAKAAELFKKTRGNALLVRQELIASGRTPTEIWEEMGAAARELATYLAVADGPLTVEDLLALRGDTNYIADQLFADLESVPELIVGTGTGFRIVHDTVLNDLLNLIKARPERIQFVAGRLGRYLAREGRVVRAYFVLARAGHEDAHRLLERASFEAARSGDWAAGLALAKDTLTHAEERLDAEQILHSRLALGQAYQMTGDIHAARQEIERAQREMGSASEDLRLYVEGFVLTFEAHNALTADAVARLERYRDRLLTADRPWHAARVSVDLSAAYINSHDTTKAEVESRTALRVFEDVGDEYGLDVARRNLASALILQSGREIEADALIRTIERAAPSEDGRRARAWLCNVLIRKNRKAGRLEEAEARAREAVSIAHDLGDEVLAAINLIGLGNTLNDKRKFSEAIASYDAAALSAQRCARHDIEAHASYVAANTYNELPNDHPLYGDASQRAEYLARHAIGLMRGTIAKDYMSRAHEALSDALFSQGRSTEAVAELFTASAFRFQLQDWDDFEHLFVTACHNTPLDNADLYLHGIDTALGLCSTPPKNATRLERMYEPLSDIFRVLPSTAILPFFGLHLSRMTRNLPTPITRRLVDLTFRLAEGITRQTPTQYWRLLYPTIILAAGCANALTVFDYLRIAESVTDAVPEVTARPESDGGARWVVILSLPAPVAISILPLDGTKSTTLACLLLALFLKGFETELSRELFQGVTLMPELTIMVADAASMPTDLQPFVASALKDAPCAVSRPTRIEEDGPSLPTNVFLSETFISGLVVGEGRGGALQALFGFTLIEVAYRLLRGTVDFDAIRPKVVKLVRQSVS